MTIKKFIRRNIAKTYILSALITILSMQVAYEWRGYLSLGGEIFILLIPAILHVWIKIEDM